MAEELEENVRALETFLMEIRACPQEASLHDRGGRLIADMYRRHPDLQHVCIPALMDVLEILVSGRIVNPRNLAFTGARQLMLKYQLEDFDPAEDTSVLRSLSEDTFFRSLLERAVNVHPGFEIFLTRMRRFLLFDFLHDRTQVRSLIPILIALAHQSFNNEYIFYEQTDEKDAVTNIVEKTASTLETRKQEDLEIRLLVTSMYRPLYRLPFADQLANMPTEGFAPRIQPVLKRTLYNPRQEEKIKAEIPVFGTITDTISRAVRSQYEENPYPRWLDLYGPFESIERRLKKRNVNFAWPDPFHREDLQILVPGCGTGQHPLYIAAGNPNARIWAVDLSKASLAYGKRMAEEKGIDNITFMHGDLMELPALKQTFHHIDCVGVLHHMEDPEKGWRVLKEILLPGGTMNIGLYSQVARLPIVFFRNEIKNLGVQPTAEDMRAFRHRLLTDQKYESLYRTVASGDFFSLSAVRDLLFHVREHRYTLSEIQKLISTFGFCFLNFIPPTSKLKVAYRAQFPEDRNMNSFENWRKFESRYAGTSGLFQFCVQKVEK